MTNFCALCAHFYLVSPQNFLFPHPPNFSAVATTCKSLMHWILLCLVLKIASVKCCPVNISNVDQVHSFCIDTDNVKFDLLSVLG